MAAKLLQDTILAVQVVHRRHQTLYAYDRCARIVVWATTSKGSRVWVRTVEGDLDQVNVSIKVAMMQKFFDGLVGEQISFQKGKKGIFFAEEESLPKKFMATYQKIKKVTWSWVEKNHTEELERLRKEKAAKAAATRKANREARELNRKRRASRLGLPEDADWEEVLRVEAEKKEKRLIEAENERKQAEEKRLIEAENERKQAEEKRLIEAEDERKALEEKRKNALKLSFDWELNIKTLRMQWKARERGRLYILRREDRYSPADGKIPVEKVFDLVPGRVVLVKRI